MKMFFSDLKVFFTKFLSVCFFLFIFFSCGSAETPDNEKEVPNLPPVEWETADFEILKGLNISGWLSQVNTRVGPRERYFTRVETKKLADWGFDHIRLPIDESEVFTTSGAWEPKALKLIHDAMGWCKDQNMRVILDLHILRSHYFNNTKDMTLWTEKKEQERFIQMWEMISEEFKQYPNSFLAYELLNEPVPPSPADWNNLLTKTYNRLRELEPQRVIVLEPGAAASISQLKNLQVPTNDKNIILSVHFYTPHLLTHYQANWLEDLKDLSIPIHYPGWLVAQEDIDTVTVQKHKDAIKNRNGYYDRAVLQARLQEALDIGAAKGLQVHVGEVGCIDNTPIDVKRNWFRDLVGIFKEHNVAFSIWGYKSNFGILNEYGTPKDKVIIEILTE